MVLQRAGGSGEGPRMTASAYSEDALVERPGAALFGGLPARVRPRAESAGTRDDAI